MENVEDEINLLDYWNVLAKRKRIIGVIAGVVTVLAIVISLLLPKVYRAEAVIMPLGGMGGGGLASMAAQLSGLSFLAGGGGASGTNKIVSILRSRTLAERVIERFGLMRVFFKGRVENPSFKPSMEQAVTSFRGMLITTEDKKNGVIKVVIEYKNPALSAELANGVLDELGKFMNENAFTMAKKNRIFLKKRLEENKRELLEAGKELSSFYGGGRISSVEPTLDVDVTVEEMEDKIQGLMGEKEEIEKKIKEEKVVKGVPQQVYLQYLILKRELLAKINALLSNQYELAKIEETKEDLSFEVIDYAVKPETRFKPRRRQIVMMAFVTSAFFACFFAFFLEYLERMREQVKGKR